MPPATEVHWRVSAATFPFLLTIDFTRQGIKSQIAKPRNCRLRRGLYGNRKPSAPRRLSPQAPGDTLTTGADKNTGRTCINLLKRLGENNECSTNPQGIARVHRKLDL